MSDADRDAAVELMAEAAFANYFGEGWAVAPDTERNTWRAECRAALDALIAAGWGPANPESADG